MSDTVILSAKFQISIPEAVRATQQWKAGQEFAFKGAKAKGYRDRKDRC